jgi:mannan endo-1,4-beta-mannosidase
MSRQPAGPVASPSERAPAAQRPPRRTARAVLIAACVLAVAAVATVGLVRVTAPIGPAAPAPSNTAPPAGTFSQHPVRITLPARPASYLGVYVKGAPGSYAPMQALTAATGVKPNIALYYSGWYEKFQSAFAVQVHDNGAVPFIQIDPEHISLSAIASGAFDTFLKNFATDVAAYGASTHQGVIIGFGHEMNGYWYSWSGRHTSPAVFVAAWRHVVMVFRQQGADDVTWLWTTNIIATQKGIASPGPWWPGSSYVTWVGIDGYFLKQPWTFASLFGPTIKAIRALTLDPILIAETGAAPRAGKAAKLADLFAGVRAYGLLGFVWFDARGTFDWRLDSPAAIAAFSRGAKAYLRPAS